ncbi:MAG: chaperone modulator CbpM [Candidatus Competibacteraceae bacterium]|jgi:chaperone modulatory protein CbpM|nr:chaperone modulator CbpM [Candidatus Competibacteraceae bacterium]
MAKTNLDILSGELLDEGTEITLVQLCRTFSVQAETIEAMVEQGILEPTGKRGHHWCFSATCIKRIRIVLRLQRDLDVNLAGAALALELLERIDQLHDRLRALDSVEAEI